MYLVELHGSDADLNYFLGSAYGFMKQWDRCVHYIQRAIDLNSSQPSWLYDLATGMILNIFMINIDPLESVFFQIFLNLGKRLS